MEVKPASEVDTIDQGTEYRDDAEYGDEEQQDLRRLRARA